MAAALEMCRRLAKNVWEAHTVELRKAWEKQKAKAEKQRKRRRRGKLSRRAKRLKKGQPLYASHLHQQAANDWDRLPDRRTFEEVHPCPDLDDWQCADVIIDHFMSVWPGEKTGKLKEQYAIYERDGWRCAVPGCTCTGPLNAHHIKLRSQGGSDEPSNLITVCFFHHIEFIHNARIRVKGRAPDELIWELGIQDDGTPLYVYHGDVLVEP